MTREKNKPGPLATLGGLAALVCLMSGCDVTAGTSTPTSTSSTTSTTSTSSTAEASSTTAATASGVPTEAELDTLQADLRGADEDIVDAILGRHGSEAARAQLQAQLAELEIDPASVSPAGEGRAVVTARSGEQELTLRLAHNDGAWTIVSLR